MERSDSATMAKVNLPGISVVIATYNSGKLLEKSLAIIRSQNYPQSKIEILLGDGRSTDNTKEVAEKFGARVIDIPLSKQHAEYNRGVAYNQAKKELVLILDHDNFLPYRDWLKDMVQPLLDNPNMVAVETCYYHYSSDYGLIDRYSALFGTSEPLPYYLGKADRMAQTAKSWVLKGQAQDRGKYYIVKFDKDPRKIPSIGTNGCIMRRKLVSKYADVRSDHHYPIDVLVDVIKLGHNEFGFVKNSIIHLQQSRGLLHFLKRRFKFVMQYHFQDASKRRWSVVMPGDEWQVAKYVFYSLTLVKPTWDALIGFMKIPDVAWFIHPVMAFITTIMYGCMTIKHRLSK